MDATRKPRTKKYTYFIGIDISRNKLDFAVFNGKQFMLHRETGNEPGAIDVFVEELKKMESLKISKALFCMERTGIYGNIILIALKKMKANIVVENPVRIRNSMGLLRGKDDKLDAMRIARFAYINREDLKFWVPRRPVLEQLMSLFALRERLLGIGVILKTPLKEQALFVKKGIGLTSAKSCARSIASIKQDLEEVNGQLEALIRSDERLSRLVHIITSVPNIGLITAIYIIICSNEFIDIDSPKKFACYAGVAPFKNESGTASGRSRVSHVANKKMKALLHICAMTARRKAFKAYFERKTAEGKPGMAVMNAIRNKLILRVFACVKRDSVFIDERV